MRWTLFLVLIVALGYQLFFRFDYWNSQEKDGVVFERDNLTGQVRQIEPGRQTDWVARLLPVAPGQPFDLNKLFQSPATFSLADTGTPEPARQSEASHRHHKPDTTAETVPPPSPGAYFSIRQVDLNLDGQAEEIIQSDADISIVKNGREIFFGKGKELSILETKNTGWSDIALTMENGRRFFRYSARSGSYETLEQ